MVELIATVALYIVKFIFEKANDKKKVGKLISEWMIVMRKEFLSSAQVSEYFEDMWAEATIEELKGD